MDKFIVVELMCYDSGQLFLFLRRSNSVAWRHRCLVALRDTIPGPFRFSLVGLFVLLDSPRLGDGSPVSLDSEERMSEGC